MPQLFAQQDRQPDVWVMSGAPTATVVYLSLQTTINYSSGSPDTLPANTPAVIYGTSDTAFDRSLDVWIPFTVRASGVLSIIKESQLATITADYVAMARVELHGIRPYQPEPYLASGALGAGGGAPSTLVLLSQVGQGKATDLGVGGSAPAGWYTPGFDDSAWPATVAQDSTMAPLAGYTGTADFVSWTTVFATAADDVWLFRQALTLPPGVITAATLQVGADNYVLDLYVGGTRVYGPGSGLNLWYTGGGAGPQTTPVPPGALSAGGTTVLAARIQNEHNAGVAQPTAFAYNLRVTYAGAGDVVAIAGPAEGALAYYHSGRWQPLPLGTPGQELTVVGVDPAWTDQPAGGTVSSVALAGPTGTTVSGSPLTSSGTITLAWATQTANTFLGAPNGSSGAPSFRALTPSDLPSAPTAGGHVHAHGHFL